MRSTGRTTIGWPASWLFAWTVCAAAVVWMAPASVFAATKEAAAELRDEASATSTGEELQQARRWIEAIDHYERALKQWPDSNALQYGLRKSKIQFSIERRYSDRSFTDQMLSLSRQDVLAHYDDVTGKVRRFYVESVSATAFVAHGTESLYQALGNERFVTQNIPNASTDELRSFRRLLRDSYWNRPCPQPQLARNLVNEIADLAYSQLRLNPTATICEYVFGGCNSLDDYSAFLTPGRLDDLRNNIRGEFVGIGIEMKAESGKGLLLVNVLPESPAEEGGCLAGEYIVGIENQSSRTLSTEEAATLLQGNPNSRVRLTLEDPQTQQSRQTVLTRRAVRVRSIPMVEIIDQEQGIGYIRMTGFQENTVEELDQALAQLQRQGMQALIWDLRGNPGGLLNAAVEVLDRFIENGVLVSTRGRTQDQNSVYSATRAASWRMPLAVLVDGDSASASEIVAGAVRDHHRGILVGRKTYGKWSVQSILEGRGLSGLRLTTAKFYSPAGNTYGKVGVEPDVFVETAGTPRTSGRGRRVQVQDDRDISAAIEALRKQMVQR